MVRSRGSLGWLKETIRQVHSLIAQTFIVLLGKGLMKKKQGMEEGIEKKKEKRKRPRD